MFLIYSYRNKAWYKPNCAGYTNRVAYAGRYDVLEVGRIVTGALAGQLIPVDVRTAQSCEDAGENIEEQLEIWRTW